MRIRTAIRKSVKWGGAAGVVLLVVVWVASGWWGISWSRSPYIACGIGGGCLWRYEFNPFAQVHYEAGSEPGFSVDRFPGPEFQWGVNWRDQSYPKDIQIPLWTILFVLLFPTAFAWRADRRAVRRARIGLCPACGYDRRGLTTGAVCPECGAAGKAFVQP